MGPISFARDAKEELARVWPASPCCRLAELAGLARSGSLELGGGGRRLVIRTDQPSVARKALHLAKSIWHSPAEVRVVHRVPLRRGRRYEVRVPVGPPGTEQITALPRGPEGGAARAIEPLIDGPCCQRAFVRGLFLGAGSVNDPRAGHHLEIVLHDADLADLVGQVLFAAGIGARVGGRKDQVLVYLKDAGHIAAFLGLVGAHQAMLRYEDARAMRDMKGQIQRLVNAETANLGKAVDASLRQIEAIAELKRRRRLGRLPAPLREIARLRLAHPDASLSELGQLCRPPIGKSGVNHRLRRLVRFAQGFARGAPKE